jgi:O-antigen/teichoic acid export membrane protein
MILSRIIKDTTTVISGNMSNAALNMAFVFVFVSQYGVDVFGQFGFYQAAILSTVIFLKPNVWQAFVKFYSTDKHTDFNKEFFFKGDFFAAIFSSVVALIISYLLIDTYLVILLIPYLLFYNNGFTIGYLRSTQKFHWYAFAQILSAFFKLLIVLTIPLIELNDYFCYIFFIDGFVWGVLYAVVLIKSKLLLLLRNGKSDQFFKNKKLIKERVKFVFGTHLSTILDLPVAHFDKLIVGVFLSPSSLGIYIILRRLGALFSILAESFSYVFFSEFSKNAIKGLEGLKETLKLVKYQVIFTVLIGTCAVGFISGFFNFINSKFFDNKLDGMLDLIILTILIQTLGLMFNWLNPLVIAHGLLKRNNQIIFFSNSIYVLLLGLLSLNYGLFGAVLALGGQFLMVAILKFGTLKVHWAKLE